MGIGEFFRRLFGSTGSNLANDDWHQFCTRTEGETAKAEINRLVDDFLRRHPERGPHNLDTPTGVNLGDAPIRQRFTIRGTGRGWRDVQNGLCALIIMQDGNWTFQGHHVWRHGSQGTQRELSGWLLTRHGEWPAINPYERTNVADVATASPVLALHMFRQAMTRWDGGAA